MMPKLSVMTPPQSKVNNSLSCIEPDRNYWHKSITLSKSIQDLLYQTLIYLMLGYIEADLWSRPGTIVCCAHRLYRTSDSNFLCRSLGVGYNKVLLYTVTL